SSGGSRGVSSIFTSPFQVATEQDLCGVRAIRLLRGEDRATMKVMRKVTRMLPILLALISAGGCAAQSPNPVGGTAAARVDSAAVVTDLRFLASEELGGRQTGTAGNQQAREYIVRALSEANVEPLGGSWTHPFPLGGEQGSGVNVLGIVQGTTYPERYIV